ncbi:MAG: nitrous oxide reductase family maturation protein NosD [Gemmatimonadaceae bacterium]
MLTTLGFSLLQALAPAGGARTLMVAPGGPYTHPVEAIAAARPGDTVRVAAGTYAGPVVIDRRLALVGAPGAVLDGRGRGTVVTVDADSVAISGFTIVRSGLSLNKDEAAVKLLRCYGCVVSGNTIGSSLHGVYLLSSHDVLIENNRITGDAKLQEAWRGNGIHLYNSTYVEMRRNTVRTTRDGLYFSFASHSTAVGNDVSNVRYGLHYMYSDDNTFTDNRFTRNAAGAAIMFSKRITFRRNTFSRHVGYRAYGILLQTAENVTAERNVIEGNLTGMFLDGSVRNIFRANTISGNGVGIDMMASSEGNTFVDNVITGNRTSARTILGVGDNAWSAEGRGNFWGGRATFDLDGDGVGDRPHRAGDPFASLAGMRPVLELWAGTPAARALAWAESAFPVFDFAAITDERPLAVRPEHAPVGATATFDRSRSMLAFAGISLLGLAMYQTRRSTFPRARR